MKVIVHLSNNDKVEKEHVINYKVENGFLRLWYMWRKRLKEIGFNKDDIRFYEVVDGDKHES